MVKLGPGEGIALDIDETLSNTVFHYFELLRQFYVDHEDLTPQEMVKKYRYISRVPYWKDNRTVLRILSEIITHNDLQERLPLVEGAVEHVQLVQKVAPIQAYISTRSEQVRKGTQAWLNKHTFPEAELITRSSSDYNITGNHWKAKVLQDRFPSVRGIVDDNEGLTIALQREFPDYQGTIFLFNHETSPDTSLDVVVCPSWTAVYEAVREKFTP